ncbi:MAG: hypothetical protein KC505_04110 [Myxococcales bacterium]|nr:hypothetical protein [Myxococcales bacterium]USN50190.1 MAG: hypothetical protein H6731_07940 [Myxococcales bacterium]
MRNIFMIYLLPLAIFSHFLGAEVLRGQASSEVNSTEIAQVLLEAAPQIAAQNLKWIDRVDNIEKVKSADGNEYVIKLCRKDGDFFTEAMNISIMQTYRRLGRLMVPTYTVKSHAIPGSCS